eukprot:CAMPEP_0172560352 /NCGR_PEP_ID=MMETSP1067-20121228/88338_1 /TAXON_ID=265564 ORGANISM="Thalassiosira punctigera, Strain Tpunct2005C2" /NCGR_SAMPLE_ID=MMETSP1067 /ASSEMBLY_ACC=CAM_ASM_000444 /LENGTH=43 /DNA_ID= /DNA_START= /DNA_END= /DNA_ORIENTATION=
MVRGEPADMLPTPESSFVLDAQAWTSMASQLSYMAVQHDAAEM